MFYSLYLFNADGETIRTETIDGVFTFADGAETMPTANGGALRVAKTQNTVYATAAAAMAATDGAERFRVYPCNPVFAALHCATAAARTAANRGGKAAQTAHVNGAATPTDKAAAQKAAAKMSRQTAAARNVTTQEIIFRELSILTAATAAAMASGGNSETDGETFIFEKVAAMAQDTQDFFSVCVLAAYENGGADGAERAAAIYKAANAYIRGNVSRRERETSTEYIMDGGGDLVAFGTAAAQILRGGEKWTPTDGGKMDAETAARLGVALAAAFELLTPTARDIVRRIVRGYSVRQIAAATRRGVATIQRNVENVRRTFAAYIAENAAEFMPLVNAATAAAATAAATAAAKKSRTDKKAAAARREREKNGTANGKTAAQRMREYRERRKAAAAANV